MAGSPAVAERAGANGKRLAVVPLPANNALAVLDAEWGTLVDTIPLGVEPIADHLSRFARRVRVSTRRTEAEARSTYRDAVLRSARGGTASRRARNR